MRNTQKRLSINNTEAISVQLVEVSDNVREFDSYRDASKFLGVHDNTIANYLSGVSKVIKSKVNGKTYLIRKVKSA